MRVSFRTLLSILIVLLIGGCGHFENKRTCALCGDWNIAFETGQNTIPARLTIAEDSLFFRNASERIVVRIRATGQETLRFEMPNYDSWIELARSANELKGVWTNNHKVDYAINFTGAKTTFRTADDLSPDTLNYLCDFEGSFAQGIFQMGPSLVTGTFLTETGDYRFLEGEKTNDKFYVSCFDGAHLFYFSGVLDGDSIKNGVFLSGNHYSEAWKAHKSDRFALRDPDSLITWSTSNAALSFRVKDLQKREKQFGLPDFSGKVTAVMIGGTWCPNCTDALQFLTEEPSLKSSENFKVVPVCFETGTEEDRQITRINQHFSKNYQNLVPYLGGPASKEIAAGVFSQLSDITAFPTVILVDKTGQIRHTHTGFYGPGTGKYHQFYTRRLTNQILSLIAE